MMASEPINGAERFHEAQERAREFYSTAISEVMEKVLEQFVMPEDKIAFLRDAAKFSVFLMTLRSVQARLLPVDWPSSLKEWRALEKELHREIPDMLHQFVRAQQAGETGMVADG